MRILVIHNKYRYRGGENTVVQEEMNLLESHNHTVISYMRDSGDISHFTFTEKVRLLRETSWSDQTYDDVCNLIRSAKPHIAHVHNTLPLISPSVYYACADMGVPVVQTLHNFRFLCPAATFLRDGEICEKCREFNLLESVWHGCYRNSRVQSAVVAHMLHQHRKRETCNLIDAFVALTEFHRSKFIQGGLPEEKIFVRANFTRPVQLDRQGPGDFVLFIGRLSKEKGLSTLINAWKSMPEIPLKIAGSGPMIECIATRLHKERIKHIELLGFVNSKHRTELLARTRFLVVPSNWYEGMPTVVLEAFAAGIPVLASRIGSLAEMIRDGENGCLFEPMHEPDLCEKTRSLYKDVEKLQELGRAGKATFERLYTPHAGYSSLMKLYENVLQNRKGKLQGVASGDGG
ncbi:glycosyltransferase family 4 protein [candidate division KSB1 bacterium]|nr:glycosyltransferase family 4 protein [candidate division KSB1 bacterium]